MLNSYAGAVARVQAPRRAVLRRRGSGVRPGNAVDELHGPAPARGVRASGDLGNFGLHVRAPAGGDVKFGPCIPTR